MNKAELVDEVAVSTSLTKIDAAAAVEAVLEVITKTLSKQDTVTLIGFGTFSISSRAARTGRNPRTGESINIAASRVPKFKAGKVLKAAVN